MQLKTYDMMFSKFLNCEKYNIVSINEKHIYIHKIRLDKIGTANLKFITKRTTYLLSLIIEYNFSTLSFPNEFTFEIEIEKEKNRNFIENELKNYTSVQLFKYLLYVCTSSIHYLNSGNKNFCKSLYVSNKNESNSFDNEDGFKDLISTEFLKDSLSIIINRHIENSKICIRTLVGL